MTSFETWIYIADNYINGNISDTKNAVLQLKQKELLAFIAIGLEEDAGTLKRIIQMVNR